jgi:hypothetical protein
MIIKLGSHPAREPGGSTRSAGESVTLTISPAGRLDT